MPGRSLPFDKRTPIGFRSGTSINPSAMRRLTIRREGLVPLRRRLPAPPAPPTPLPPRPPYLNASAPPPPPAPIVAPPPPSLPPGPPPAASRWPPRVSPRPALAPTGRHIARVLARSNLLQIDSVNVLVRAHYMPLFSRLGAYGRAAREDRLPTEEARRLRVLGPRGLADSPRSASPVPLAHGARGAGRGHLRGARPVRRGRSAPSSRRCGARSRRAAPERRRARGRPQAARAHGGAGATASGPSNGCSGPARSPPPRGGASSASTTFRSGFCRRRS